MKASRMFSTALQARPAFLAGVLAVSVALAAAYIDWRTWIELNVSIVYSTPLVLSIATRSRRLLWSLAIFLVAVTFVVYAAQIPAGAFSLREPFFVDRVLAAAVVLLTACLIHARLSTLGTLDAQRRLLRQQNEELDRHRRAAEEASRRKTLLLATASHDIRTPVNTISLMAEVIRRAAEDPSLANQLPDLAARLQANALSLSRLISDLLEVARFDSGRVEVRESIFSLDNLLAEQCRDLHPLADAKSVRLEVEALDQPVRVRTDQIKLTRVVFNLIGNAIKFTQVGSVAVKVSVTPHQVLIAVRDTGVGIAAEHLDHIFDEFLQLQDGRSETGGGWGLGLPICRRLMKALGGGISVESEPGRGSTFVASLPSRCIVDTDRHRIQPPLVSRDVYYSKQQKMEQTDNRR